MRSLNHHYATFWEKIPMSHKHTFADALIFGCLVGACLEVDAVSADELPAKANIFVSGTGGYHTYRIPAVIVSASRSAETRLSTNF